MTRNLERLGTIFLLGCAGVVIYLIGSWSYERMVVLLADLMQVWGW